MKIHDLIAATLVIFCAFLLIKWIAKKRSEMSQWLKWNLSLFVAMNCIQILLSFPLDIANTNHKWNLVIGDARLAVCGIILGLAFAILSSGEIARLRKASKGSGNL